MNEYRRRKAWEAGEKAAKSGKPRESNNRLPGTIFFDDWFDGYDHAEREQTHDQ